MSKFDDACFLVNVFLPDLKKCRLSFLQAILSEEKKSLDNDQVQTRQLIKHYEEFAVHNVWDLVKSSATLRSYLPSNEMDLKRFPNRDWFWGVALTVVPHWAN